MPFAALKTFLRHGVALVALACAVTPAARAQVAPANEGLVADTTELRVLRQFYTATGGPQWSNHTNWLSGSTLAEAATWNGVRVQDGDVVGLYLYATGLRGSLPASVGELRGLRTLSLPVNQLSGSLPNSLGQLSQLTEMYLWQNQLTGALPASLGQLSQLEVMGLQQNQFSGPIPPALGNLSRLQVLALSVNQLSGPIPAELGQLTNLRYLDLYANRLSGPIPASLGQLQQLDNLSLAVNGLVGPLPAELGQLARLTSLQLWQNNFQDSIPAAWGQLRQLQQLNLNQSGLRGHLPAALAQLTAQLTALRALSVYLNQLAGPLPAGLSELPQLVALDMEHNQIRGPLPTRWTASLQTLRLGNNRFSGPLPAGLTAAADLTTLRLGNNQLTGTIPSDWGRLTALTEFWLGRNQLTGSLPDALAGLTRVTYFDVSQNQLTGPLPDSLGNWAALGVLYLQQNQFSGSLPASLARNPNLYVLNAANNRFTGELPPAWAGLARMAQLDLSTNQLRGSLAPLLGMRNLSSVNLSNNRLDQPLPAGLGQLPNLWALYADNNRLPGPLPAALGLAPHLGQLTLSNNRLSGTVPASVLRAPGLSTLYLQGNEFTSIEDLGRATNLPAVGSVGGNRLDYASLERLYAAKGQSRFAGIWYNLMGMDARWQRPLPGTDTVRFQRGQELRLTARGLAGAHTFGYQWQRLVGGQWADLPGDTLATKTWAQATVTEQGTYRLLVHDRWFTDQLAAPTELSSPPVYADLLPYAPLARNRPDDTNVAPALVSPAAAPDARASGQDLNFVRTWTPRQALTRASRVPRAPADSVAMSTTYLDGLGRPVQTVLRQASPQRRDMVQPQAYDALGRETRQYLPYADSVNGRGGYRYRALSQQQDFYYRFTPPGGGAGPLAPTDAVRGVARTGRAFAESLFEPSPLNRVVAQGAPGEAWSLTGGHAPELTERPNLATDSVPRFVPGYDPARVDPGFQGYYAPGELWGSQRTDEHGRQALDWTDKEGHMVLKQVEAACAGPEAAPRRRWLRTAYAYDDFGRLRYVLQPEATKQVLPLGDKAAPLPPAAQPFLFHYRYDGRGRPIAKQVPGTDGETLVVFDQLDRPVLSQDAAQRGRREWSFTKYDALGRIALAGLVLYADTSGQGRLQALADAAGTTPESQYEQRTSDLGRYPHAYTTDQSFPRLNQQGFGPGAVLSATYYDDYNFDNDAAGVADASYDTSTDGQFPSGAAPVADALRTTGLSTRTKTRVLGVAPADASQAAWLTTTTFYDERARPVQVQTSNARKGTDLLTTQLDFTGKVVQSVAVHEGPNHAPLTVAEFFTYDHTGRLLTTRQQLPGEAQPVRIDSVAYNEIGQATQKTMGTGRLQQELDFAYNIRGWLTSLNDPYHPNPTKHDLFNLSLHYEQGFSQGYEQYNGNLTGQTWRSARDGVQRAYGYVYDPLNRLLQGDFVARNTTTPATPTAGLWKAEEDNYRLAFASYDDHGNLLTLRRRGLLANATHATAKQFGPVDELTYAYAGNRLQAVDDAVSGNQLPRPRNYNGAPTSLAGDFQEGGTHQGQEYLYDANGNLSQDRNKGITGIAYNHLNLPRQIHFGIGADSIVFRYTAAGQKVAKLVYQTGKPMLRTDYLGPYQYEQDSLRFFPHAEGRVLRFANTTSGAVRYEREFTFKDHLGNLRLAYRLGQVRTLKATLEQDATTHGRESQQFDSLSVSPPVAVPTGLARTGAYAARLNAGGSAPRPLGPLTQFAVQQGDTIRATAFGLYPQATSNNSFAFSLAGFVASLLQPAPNAPAGLDGARRGGLPLLQVGLSSATLTALGQLPGGVPQGYLRVLSFNEDSVLVDQRTVQLSAAALGHYEALSTGPLVVQQNGYVSVYVGNESAADVYFDDVTIEHRPGLQVQENQYDPFGLDLAGVSGAAPGLRLKNFYQFNGKENQLDLGLNWNHQDWRFFDYQLGRWHGLDPMIEDGQENWTPYAFSYNNAVRYSDPDGQFPPLLVAAAAGAAIGAIIGGGIEAGTQMYRNGGHVSDWHAVGGAALQGGVTGGVAGLTGGTSLLRSGAAGAISNVAGGGSTKPTRWQAVTVGSVSKDAAIGAATGVAGYAAGKAVGAVANRLRGGAAQAEAGAARGAVRTPCGCFTAGTGVSTRLGRKPIEQIQVGDSVWAYNERTRQTALRPVTHLFRYERDTVYVLHTATGEALRTTSDHPFYVRGQWVRVKRLRVGDSLVSQRGQRHVLRRIDLQPEHVTVYNFTVDELHTYFVGQNAILVHNSGPCPVKSVIQETQTAPKSGYTSKHTLTESQALEAGEQFAGKNATEIGKNGSGVYRSTTPNSNGTVNQFRMDNNGLRGAQIPGSGGAKVPHVHLEVVNPATKAVLRNNHIPIKP